MQRSNTASIQGFIFLIFLSACADNRPLQEKNIGKISVPDSTPFISAKTEVRYDLLKMDFMSADSVLLLSHHSPNMPIKNPKTGQYYPGNIEFISHDTINYNTSVQERMHLNKRQIDDLLAILTLQGSDDGLRAACFQPRNAVVVFKNNKMSCFDFCFDCYGFSTYGTFSSDLIMNPEKYHKLMGFYKKLKFKYELE